ncbi:PREDICTED: uncharacterized protein LOC107357352 [Acropora digitifera]|uniref:uncharacterized protein LOC107357352 n=1 Tax=Acropora digitifera TaxID=70779 RepID=UPI00077B1F7E|nr:PREDICTED: uncharacterized protein LOC107357352 [Acropora digitifera]
MGHTRLYRCQLLFSHQVFSPAQDHMMFKIELAENTVKCSERVVSLHEATLEEKMKLASGQNEHCDAQHMSLLNLINFPNNTIPQCDIPLSGETPEVDEIVRQAISHDPNNLMLAANSLYQLAQDKLVNSKEEAPEALGILRVASCLRHSKSQYTAGIMNLIGLGVPQDKSQV